MICLQIAANGLVLGGLYACIAVGFSLVWGVLNVINILHGTFIVLGSYVAYFAYVHLGIHPFVSIAIAGGMLYALGHALQAGIINRVVTAPVLITLTLTFGLDLILNNAMLVAFTADYRAIVAVRMDREAAALMGVDIKRINAITFGIGAFMAGAAGALLSIIFPISPLNSPVFLGKAFVVCVLGGLGSVPGALVGGLVLGVIESFGSYWLRAEGAGELV